MGFCRAVCRQHEPGTRFTGFNNNLSKGPDRYASCHKYGFIKQCPADPKEGARKRGGALHRIFMLIENFDPILDDYAFFEAHSTEAEADLDAYKRHLNGVLGNSGLFRMLDFGCGAGSFTDRLLRQSASDPASIELTLVEPGAQARERAVQALRPYSKHAIAHFPELPAGLTTRFDFILANHVLYFVPDLTRTLRQLSRHVLPTGRFLVAMAGTENALIRCWAAGFG